MAFSHVHPCLCALIKLMNPSYDVNTYFLIYYVYPVLLFVLCPISDSDIIIIGWLGGSDLCALPFKMRLSCAVNGKSSWPFSAVRDIYSSWPENNTVQRIFCRPKLHEGRGRGSAPPREAEMRGGCPKRKPYPFKSKWDIAVREKERRGRRKRN